MNHNINTLDTNNTLRLRLSIARLSFLRFDEKCLLESVIKNMHEFSLLTLDDISLLVGRRLRTRLWKANEIIKMVEIDIIRMHSYDTKVLFYDSIEYPRLLKEIYDPPYALFCRGNTSILDTPAVAIVGTRKPSIECANATKHIAKDIAMAGISVVSGLAFGIDAQAHLGALMAQGCDFSGKTIAVLGSGVDTITPASNKRLAKTILASEGCIISEYQLGSTVQNWQFVQRNRIISALCRVTLVMEAPPGSGALHTADFTIEHNRELCFYKGAIKEKMLQTSFHNVDLFGSIILDKKCVESYIQDGAIVVNDAQDVLKLMNTMTFLEDRAFYAKQ